MERRHVRETLLVDGVGEREGKRRVGKEAGRWGREGRGKERVGGEGEGRIRGRKWKKK